MASSRGRGKNAGKAEGGDSSQPSTGQESVTQGASKAQIQRARAKAAKERFLAERKKAEAARKAAETKARRRLAAAEREVAAQALAAELSKAEADLVDREVQKTVDLVKEVAAQPVKTQADEERRRRARNYGLKEIERVTTGDFSPAEKTEIKKAAVVNVELGREMMEQAALDFYDRAKAEGRIERISKHHKPGTIAKVNYRERKGVVADRRSGKLLTETNLEDILHAMMKSAEAVGKRQKGGKLYATFSYFEYGKDRPRSGYTIPIDPRGDPAKGIMQDEFGPFYQSFDATNYLGGAEDAAALEVRLREVLERKVKEGGGKNAAILIGYQMKSYIERTEEERKEFDRAMWRKIKRAQRKAEKLAKEKGEKTWVDMEEIERGEKDKD